MIVSHYYPIFDDKQIKEVLKGINSFKLGIDIKDELSGTDVHEQAAKLVPFFCKEGYGVNFAKESIP